MYSNFVNCFYYKMRNKILIILLFQLGLLAANNLRLSPMVKSFFVPGWGQVHHDSNVRARFFNLAETIILSGYVFSVKFSEYEKSKYISFAARHANINFYNKDREFWVDIGNYEDIYNYNQEQLRLRSEDLYDDINEYFWSWDHDKNRKIFEEMRIKSDFYKKSSQFLIGGLVLNHIISAIDALYLTRLKTPLSFDVTPSLDRNQTVGITLNMIFSF